MTAPTLQIDETALARIRDEIDDLDRDLLDLVRRRCDLALSTLDVKRDHALPRRDHRREAAVVTRSARMARERGLEPELVRDIFWRLIELSHRGFDAADPRDGR